MEKSVGSGNNDLQMCISWYPLTNLMPDTKSRCRLGDISQSRGGGWGNWVCAYDGGWISALSSENDWCLSSIPDCLQTVQHWILASLSLRYLTCKLLVWCSICPPVFLPLAYFIVGTLETLNILWFFSGLLSSTFSSKWMSLAVWGNLAAFIPFFPAPLLSIWLHQSVL